jgi:glycerophosphoryl diester phosphodiesterase
MMHTFDLQAHRGGRLVRPENTLAAFGYAIRLGVSTLELDMHVTADNEVVISHNPVLSWYLARDGQGQWIKPGYEPVIYAMTLDEVRQYNVSQVNPGCVEYWRHYGQHQQSAGYEQVPTLAEVFALVQRYEADAIRFNIETKCYPGHPEWSPEPDQFCQSVLAVVDQFGMQDRVMVQSFDWRTLIATRQLNKAITCVALTDSECRQTNDKGLSPWLAGLNLADYGGSIVQAAKAAGADILSPHYHDVTREMMKEADYLHMPVIPWTVNNRHDMTELIDIGVAGLISDDPALLRQVMAERKLPLPPAYVLKK